MSTNFNISTINALGDINNILSNITINNTIKIPHTPISNNTSENNANACILLKDRNSNGSGNYYSLQVDSLDNSVPYIYFNNNVVIDSSNFLSELESTLQNYTLDTSNLTVSGGYINFHNGSNPNILQGSSGVGLRYSSNNTIQFKNYDTNWIDL